MTFLKLTNEKGNSIRLNAEQITVYRAATVNEPGTANTTIYLTDGRYSYVAETVETIDQMMFGRTYDDKLIEPKHE